MKMIKHVGKHDNKRCIILFREVPNEDHMCLVCYPETLPKRIHDDVMLALESEAGQQSKDFSDYLFRYTMTDGNNALTFLHSQGMIKKVPSNQVIVTPNAKNNIRLDELNKILNKMALGEEAIKELADLDSSLGMGQGKRRNNEPKEVGVSPVSRSQPVKVDNNISISDVLTDEQLALQRRLQADKMLAEAQQLINEAKRLQDEASSFVTGANEKNVGTKTKKTKTNKVNS